MVVAATLPPWPVNSGVLFSRLAALSKQGIHDEAANPLLAELSHRGKTATQFIVPAQMSDGEIFQKIANPFGQGKQVVLGTKDVIPALPGGLEVAGDHAYLVKKIFVINGTTFVELSNPWGTGDVSIPIDLLSEVAAAIDVLDSLD